MMSPGKIILEYVCPAMGTILANVMFSAPFRDVKKAVERGHLGDLNPTPWAFMLGNCCGWVTYAILIQNMWIFFANAPGFVLSVWLNMGAAKLQYEGFRAMEMRKSFATYLEQSSRPLSVPTGHSREAEETQQRPLQKVTDFGKVVWEVTAQTKQAPTPHENITIAIVLIWLVNISLISLADFSQSTKELIIGCVVNLNLVFFYGAPLSTILTVLRTRNSVSIHIMTMATNTANGAFWTAYGLAVLDPFIYVPNGLGAALGVVQIFLVLTFPRILLEEVANFAAGSTDNYYSTKEACQEADEGALEEDGTAASDTALIKGEVMPLHE
jgi:solute carrier family 50 protein (sugar transporter)